MINPYKPGYLFSDDRKNMRWIVTTDYFRQAGCDPPPIYGTVSSKIGLVGL